MHDNTKQFKRIKEKIKFNINIESGMRVVLGTFFFFSQVKNILLTLQLSPKFLLEKSMGKYLAIVEVWREYDTLLILPIPNGCWC